MTDLDLERRLRDAFAAHRHQVVVPPELLDGVRAAGPGSRTRRWRTPVLLAAAAVIVALTLVGALVRSTDREPDGDGEGQSLEVAGTPTVSPGAFDDAADAMCREMGGPAVVFPTADGYTVVAAQRQRMLVLAVADLAGLDAPADDVELPGRVLSAWRAAQAHVRTTQQAVDDGRLDDARVALMAADTQIAVGAAELAEHGADRCRGVGT